VSGVGISGNVVSIDSATQVTIDATAALDGSGNLTFLCPASNNYDIFGYIDDDDDEEYYCLGPVWTNDTTRATAITQKDGVPVLTGAFIVAGTSYAEGRLRHVGMVRTTATAGQTEDSVVNGFIASVDNQVVRKQYKYEGTGHSYTTAAWRDFNGSSTSTLINWIQCNSQALFLYLEGQCEDGAGYMALDIDDVGGAVGAVFKNGNSEIVQGTCVYPGVFAAGKHSAICTEYGAASFYVWNAAVYAGVMR
jgi:hypothetical protein